MPFVVTIAQVLVLDFPETMWYYAGMKYTPWSKVLYPPLVIGLLLALCIFGADRFFHWVNRTYPRYKRLASTIITIFLILVYWESLMYAQRVVIMEYLSAINANGMHFLRLLYIPLFPESFADYDLGWFIVLVIVLLGIAGILVIHNYFRNKTKNI